MKRYLLLLFVLLLSGCGKKEPMTVAFDPNWFGAAIDPSEENFNGFVEDFLLTFSKDKGKELYKVEVNWDNLQDGLIKEKYQAILTSLYPYNFEKAKFDFSKLFFPTGSVLVHKNKRKSHYGINLGVRRGDNSEPALKKMPKANLYDYESYPELLQALDKGHIDYAVMPYIQAVNYLSAAFHGDFSMEMPPLDDKGIRLAVKKGTNGYLLRSFDALIEKMQKRSDYQKLLKKWDLFVE